MPNDVNERLINENRHKLVERELKKKKIEDEEIGKYN